MNLTASEKGIVGAVTAILTIAVSLGFITSTTAQLIVGIVPTVVVFGYFIVDEIEKNSIATRPPIPSPTSRATRSKP